MTARQRLRLFFAGLVALLATCAAATAWSATPSANASLTDLAGLPQVKGWARTCGGCGGEIARVTTLNGAGPGSLRAAIESEGKRIVVFEVAGVIDLDKQNLVVRHPNITIAGQTAPSPGITLIRGGISIRTHDVIVQHLRVRPGSAGETRRSGYEVDGIATGGGARDVVVDHNSITWATDENLSAGGLPFQGDTPAQWRDYTSHRITFSNNIVAEGLFDASHSKAEHSMGSLVMDNVTDILLYGNLYAHNFTRNPFFKGGTRGAVVNNVIYNPGKRALHYTALNKEWGDREPILGRLTAVGNVLRGGPSTSREVSFLVIGSDSDLDYHGADNIATSADGNDLTMVYRHPRSRGRVVRHDQPLDWPEGLHARPALDVETQVYADVGARPWDRDDHDARIVHDFVNLKGGIIDTEIEVGGYPHMEPTRRAFDPRHWDLETMTPRSPDLLY